MTDRLRAAAQAALEALINGKNVRAGEGGTKRQSTLEDAAIEQLRSALAEQPPEPEMRRCPRCWEPMLVPVSAEQDAEPFVWYEDATGDTWTPDAVAEGYAPTDLRPLYAHPPRREWQTLTDEEVADIALDCYAANGGRFDDFALAAAVEAALRAKNGGGE